MGDEGTLHGVQLLALGQSLDRDQVGAVAHHGKGQAGIDPLAVAQHRAGAALAVVTTFFAADQIEVLTQQIEQGRPWLDV
ncbi:hypothetical protein D3C81_1616920 [compost metagenome]